MLIMKFRKPAENKNTANELFKEINKCKPEELHSLLHKIEKEIEKSKCKDENLLSAKRIITSRIASMRSKNL